MYIYILYIIYIYIYIYNTYIYISFRTSLAKSFGVKSKLCFYINPSGPFLLLFGL